MLIRRLMNTACSVTLLANLVKQIKSMKELKKFEWCAFLALFALLAFAGFYLVPDPSLRHLQEPPYAGSLGALLVAVVLIILRLKIPRDIRLEKLILALFIGGMPVIYLWSAFIASDRHGVVIESLGIVIFGSLALLGYFRSPWFLVGGIAAHALAW